MGWDKWTKITVFGAFIEIWIFIIGMTVVVAAAKAGNSCSDSDGGNAITVFGTVSGYYKGQPYSYSDSCVNSQTIKEYYCSGKYQTSSQQSCGTDAYVGSNYCLNGDVYRDYIDYYCTGGACSSNTTPILQQDCQYGCTNGVCNQYNDSCSDTDSGYDEFLVQGTVSGYLSGSPYSYTDACVDNVTLSEWTCYGTQAYNIPNYPCAANYTTMCLNGACA